MANYYAWISIQSGFGLTISELGGLSSSTDPKLIASTLMALKDIISIEASGTGSSQFMTGSVENSSYGTFSISISDSLQLIMSYIVSTDKGSVVDVQFVEIITDLILNLGKQLTQFGEITDLVNSGARLPRAILIQAYLNACTILRTERNLDEKPRQLVEGYKIILKELFVNTEELLSLFEETLDEEWEKNDEYWNDYGILKDQYREQLIEAISDYTVFELANKQPDLFLYSKKPRAEQKIVHSMVQEKLSSKILETEKLISKQLINEMKGTRVEKYVKKISIVDLHNAERQIQREFVRRAYYKIITKNPLHLLKKPDDNSITSKFNEIVPEIKIENAGYFIYQGIKDKIPVAGHSSINAFFQGFMQGMSETKLTQTAMDMMIAFTQSFVASKDLSRDIKDIKGIEKVWGRELTKYIKSKTIKNLQVDSIEEAVLLSNAAGFAIVTSLSQILLDHFFITKDHIGSNISGLVHLYNLRGKSIKISSTLFGFLKMIGDFEYSSTFITPSYKDFVYSIIINNKLSFMHKKNTFQYQTKNSQFVSGKEKIHLYEMMDRTKNIILLQREKKFEIDFENISLNWFISYMQDPINLINSCIFAARRRFNTSILFEYKIWRKKIDKILEKLQVKLNQGLSMKHFSDLDLSPPSYSHFGKLDLGDHAIDLLNENAELCSAKVQLLSDEIDSLKRESLNKGEIPKKSDKKIEKLLSQVNKEIQKIDTKLVKNFEQLFKEIEKVLNNSSNNIRTIIQPVNEDILKYNYSSNDFLPRMKTIKPTIDRFMEKTEGIETEDIYQLILSITLSLYTYPPVSVYDSAYDEIISGKRSKNLKKIMGKVKSKKQFERQLKENGEQVSSKLYNDLSDLINLIDKQFVNKDGIVSTDTGNLFLNFGRLRVSKFPKTQVISDFMKIEGINPIRETSDWLIALNFTKEYDFEYDDPSIVTFSDAIRFIQRKIFESATRNTFEGLATVANMVEAGAGNKVEEVFNKLKNAIFNTDVSY